MLGFFKRKKNTPEISSERITLTISELIRETDDATTLIFETTPEIPYLPGQFLTVIFNIEGQEVRRSYSLCSAPETDKCPSITIKKIKNGLVSNYVHDHLSPGDTIEVLKPLGKFVLNTNDAPKNIIAIAAGSGITPVMSIIKSALHNSNVEKVWLIFGNRDEKNIIFKNKLEELCIKHNGKFKTIHALSQPTPNWNGIKGRLNATSLYEILKQEDIPLANTQSFLCGPAGFMDEAKKALLNFGIEEKNIIRESFISETKQADTSTTITEQHVSIIVNGNEHDVIVPKGRSILESGLDKGLDMPFSCQSGLCSACRGKLIAGKIHMDEDEGLTDNELEEGYVLCCVGHPLTDDVKIEIG